jgi:tripartite-type tricarboxylate transporter receptor subunit TctC
MPIRHQCVALALLVTFATEVSAESNVWPSRPVKIVVPFGPGGNTDIVARIVARDFGDAFGQPFIVENRPGAAGVLGAEIVARAGGWPHVADGDPAANRHRSVDEQDAV